MLVLDLVLIALVITLEPIPLTAFILVLASKNGARKGAAFIFGWLASLAAVVSVTLLITANHPPRPETVPSVAALIIKMIIGAVLVWIAVRRSRKRNQPRPPKKTPKWQAGIDSMSPWFAMALGPLTQPWGLVAAGVTVIVEAKLGTWLDWFAIVAYCLLASGAYIAAEVYALARPAKTQVFLGQTRVWIDTHTDQIIIIGSFVLGFWLIGRSVYAILT